MSTEVKDLIPVEVHDELQGVVDFLNSISEIKIDSEEQFEKSGKILVDVKSTLNNLEAKRKVIVKPKNDEVTAINSHFKQYTDKLLKAETTFKSARAVWYAKREQIKAEEQKKLEAEAAEVRRKAEEKAEAERKKAEAYREQGKEALADKAEARAETAETIAVNTVAPVIEKINTGSSTMKKVWKIRVEDEATAKKFLANNPALACYLKIDETNLQKFVSLSKGKVQVEGIAVYEDYQESVRTR